MPYPAKLTIWHKNKDISKYTRLKKNFFLGSQWISSTKMRVNQERKKKKIAEMVKGDARMTTIYQSWKIRLDWNTWEDSVGFF